MGTKKDDSGRIPKSSFKTLLSIFNPCPLFGVQFKSGVFLYKIIYSYILVNIAAKGFTLLMAKI